MAETVQLKAFGRVDLDGSHRAVIEADWPENETSTGDAQSPRYIRLEHGPMSCGCLLSEVRRSGEGRIHVDRFKLWHLGSGRAARKAS